MMHSESEFKNIGHICVTNQPKNQTDEDKKAKVVNGLHTKQLAVSRFKTLDQIFGIHHA